jgi:hypothetical protein
MRGRKRERRESKSLSRIYRGAAHVSAGRSLLLSERCARLAARPRNERQASAAAPRQRCLSLAAAAAAATTAESREWSTLQPWSRVSTSARSENCARPPRPNQPRLLQRIAHKCAATYTRGARKPNDLLPKWFIVGRFDYLSGDARLVTDLLLVESLHAYYRIC